MKGGAGDGRHSIAAGHEVTVYNRTAEKAEALAAEEERRVPMPVASVVRDRLVEAPASGGAGLDWAAMAKMAARDAGE